MVTNQTIVLKALYWKGKSMSPQEIVKESGLAIKQVYIALHHLKNMRYIKTTFVPLHYVNGEMINNQTSSEVVSMRLTEMNLKKKGVL